MRRHGLAMALAGLMAASIAPAAAAPPQTSAPHAILVEAETGSVLYEKQADDLVAPASLAKLMTVSVVFDQIELGNIKLDDTYLISENAWRKGGAMSHGSTMYAVLNSKVRVEDLLKGILIQSANDGCIALAEGVAGNEASFVRMMNDRARELGLTKSTFTNVDGLPDPKMRVTPRELAMIARHIVNTYPEFYKWFGEREFTWNKIRQQNRNPILGTVEGADGLKTGFTNEAGYNLVGSATRNGLRLILVITGLKNAKDRGDEAKKLIDYGFREFEARPLFAENQTIAEAKVYGGAQGKVPVTAGAQIKLMVPRNVSERISAKMVYSGPVRAPIREGQEIGKLQVMRGEAKVLEVPVQATEAVEVGSVTQRAFDAAAELVVNVFRSAAKRL
ncbi:D-alanyl-D-alanine carboxypeptidase family protein [Rhodoplanes sp. Z2-YC6860]|uniref:D-alanyl-D-alanine carboxypeptidase family protein n=1 Tax=Rhodoplanes sp. Z2-YC6860 TaxID=674703 RepID=UPI00078E3964|nr:D-alanyl-D-alanine carboxypeptidase family protein [Rhodoplanes sp. Z2-YC6860]AMN42418.1 D-alanyl-D-alanine carboxypeptidase [Rhodoplanes sp. Z2-YC6860]